MRNTERFMALLVAAALAGCGGETTSPERTDADLGAPAGKQDSTAVGTPGTSNGTVATLVVTPRQMTVRQGYYAQVIATSRDAKGALVAGVRPAWRSSNGNVVIASDTGVIYAKAVGSAWVYATINTLIDSASVIVTAAPPDTTINAQPSPVAAFNITFAVVGPLVGTDTSRTEPVAGVTIAATRVGGVQGDTLNPPVAAGTAVTNASGAASFQNLPGGSYTFLATPPAGSAYVATTSGISRPTTSAVNAKIVMRRAP